MPGLLLVNPRAGTATPSAEELTEAARLRGIETRALEAGDAPAQIARETNADVIGVAGGDGTISSVAAAAVERDLPFVCIPFGTRNHFARDAGIDPDDPVAALAAFDGIERRIDVGRAGDRIFLNNVSLGVYARLVHRREHHRRRSEALARLRALAITLRRRHPIAVRVDGRPLSARILLIANNAYKLDVFSLGERERLDEGLLYLYAAEGLFPSTWTERKGERFTIDLGAGRARAAIDGEPVELESPCEITIEPKRLRLLMPPPA